MMAGYEDAVCAVLPDADRRLEPGIVNVRRISTILLLFGVAWPMNGQDNGKRVLLRARQNVTDTLNRLPKYVCTQTIDRRRYEPDRLRARAGVRGSHRGWSCLPAARLEHISAFLPAEQHQEPWCAHDRGNQSDRQNLRRENQMGHGVYHDHQRGSQ